MAAGEGHYVTMRTKARERVLQNKTRGPYEVGKLDDISGQPSVPAEGTHGILCGELDVSKAISKQIDASMFPTMIQSQSGDTFFLLSEPDSAGSRAPPAVEINNGHHDRLISEASVSGHAFGSNSYELPSSSKSANKTDAVSLGLPALRTGLSEDDLRESAYEVLLAFSGIAINSLENPKKDKGSRFLSGLFEQIDTIRAQMQISEAMDRCIRQRLMQFSVRNSGVQVDIPQIVIELLSGIQQNDFLIERSYTQWRKRQANVLEELFSSVNYPEMQELGILLDKIRNPEEWNIIMTPAERAEVLLAIRQVASSLSSMGSSHIQGGSSYWNAGYHLNIRLYERLLFGVFDILDEGQLIEEHADYLKLVKLTWGTLGITQKMHDALYGWVLFQQFVETKEMPLLDQANLQVQKVLSTNYKEGNEEQFTYTIMYTDDDDGTEIRLSLVQAIFRSINLWCDARLQDYHLHFNEKPVLLRRLVSMGLVVGRHNTATVNEVKVKSSDASADAAAVRVRFYVKRSLEAALQRVEDTINLISKMEGKHPLALLARELILIAERELSVFSPVLCQWCPDAGIFASVHLHQYYGERLKPFLDNISFSEDAISVLSEAHHLEHYLIRASNLINEENGVGSLSIQEFESYLLPSLSLRRKQVTEPQPPKKARGRPRKAKPEVEVEQVSADSGVLELLTTEGENLPDKELKDTESSKAEQREDEHAQVTEPQPPKKARGRPRKAKPEVEVEGKKVVRKRGRPQKERDGSSPPKRPRGRPVKQVKQVEQDDTSLSLVFERLCIDISKLSDDPLPDIVQDDMLDESEIIKMEEAHEVYKAAIDNLEHENEEALTAAADARLLLQSILLRS